MLLLRGLHLSLRQQTGPSALAAIKSSRGNIAATSNAYLILSKHKLSALVALSAACGYALAPGTVDIARISAASLGTLLTSFSASAFNQVIESPLDSQMARTQGRPVATKRISVFSGFNYGLLNGVCGLLVLKSQCGPIPAALALANIALYAGVYTPLKQFSCSNTAVGAVVGAVPPLIGWASSGVPITLASAWVLPAILFLWQFPHFNPLSWRFKNDYVLAGYRMQAAERPNALCYTSLLATVALQSVCILAFAAGVVTPCFVVLSGLVNAPFVLLAWLFHKRRDLTSSRRLFLYSLFYLPAIMVMLLVFRTKRVRPDHKVELGKEESSCATLFVK